MAVRYLSYFQPDIFNKAMHYNYPMQAVNSEITQIINPKDHILVINDDHLYANFKINEPDFEIKLIRNFRKAQSLQTKKKLAFAWQQNSKRESQKQLKRIKLACEDFEYYRIIKKHLHSNKLKPYRANLASCK